MLPVPCFFCYSHKLARPWCAYHGIVPEVLPTRLSEQVNELVLAKPFPFPRSILGSIGPVHFDERSGIRGGKQRIVSVVQRSTTNDVRITASRPNLSVRLSRFSWER